MGGTACKEVNFTDGAGHMADYCIQLNKQSVCQNSKK